MIDRGGIIALITVGVALLMVIPFMFLFYRILKSAARTPLAPSEIAKGEEPERLSQTTESLKSENLRESWKQLPEWERESAGVLSSPKFDFSLRIEHGEETANKIYRKTYIFSRSIAGMDQVVSYGDENVIGPGVAQIGVNGRILVVYDGASCRIFDLQLNRMLHLDVGEWFYIDSVECRGNRIELMTDDKANHGAYLTEYLFDSSGELSGKHQWDRLGDLT